MFTAKEIRWERFKRRCTPNGDVDHDLAAFEQFCKLVRIEHPAKGYVPFVLRDAQRETARAFIADDQVLILKARQIGFTTLTMVFVLWEMLFKDDFSVIVLSKKKDDAKANLKKSIDAWNKLPDDFKAVLPRRLDKATTAMKFGNGSWIESHASLNNPARGRTASRMILDEWAFMPNDDEAWAAVKPVTDIGGSLIALSTANGVGNLFHEHWQAARRKDNSWKPIFYPWSAVPDRDQEWYDQQARDMPGWQIAQEYPSSEEEAFVKSGNPVFDLEMLREHPICPPKWSGEIVGQEALTEGLGFAKAFSLVQAHGRRPTLHTWDHDPTVGRPAKDATFVIGADTSGGEGKRSDFSSAHVLCAQTGEVVATWHGRVAPDEYGMVLARLGYWYNTALLVVEHNNHGSTVNACLQRLAYPRLYYRTREGQRYEEQTDAVGWWTSAATKPRMMDELNMHLRERMIVLHDNSTLVELSQYVKDQSGKMMGQPHDDRVISLAVAVQGLKFAASPSGQRHVPPPPGTLGWFLRQQRAKRARAGGGVPPIGGHNIRKRKKVA